MTPSLNKSKKRNSDTLGDTNRTKHSKNKMLKPNKIQKPFSKNNYEMSGALPISTAKAKEIPQEPGQALKEDRTPGRVERTTEEEGGGNTPETRPLDVAKVRAPKHSQKGKGQSQVPQLDEYAIESQEKKAPIPASSVVETTSSRVLASTAAHDESEEDDQTAALLRGFESSDDEDAAQDEGFQQGQALPSIPAAAERRTSAKNTADLEMGQPGVVFVGYVVSIFRWLMLIIAGEYHTASMSIRCVPISLNLVTLRGCVCLGTGEQGPVNITRSSNLHRQKLPRSSRIP